MQSNPHPAAPAVHPHVSTVRGPNVNVVGDLVQVKRVRDATASTKTCLPGDSIRKRKAQKNNSAVQLALLQKKVNDLVSILGAGPALNSPHSDARLPPASNPIRPNSSFTAPDTPGSSGGSSASSVLESPLDEVEESLCIFRKDMLKYFPFLNLPSDVQWLKKERPFLLLCIIAVTSRSTPKRRELGKKIKQILAQRMILDEQSAIDIDLLRGLLTLISWGHDQLPNSMVTSLSRFTQFAMALVFELRLNKPPPAETNMLPVSTPATECATLRRAAGSMEERRAILGCSVISSIVSSYFAYIDAMQWTPYMDECLQLLIQARECPFDESFAHQVKLQLIWREYENVNFSSVPPAFCLKTLYSKLNEVKSSMSPQLQENEILRASVYFVELSIFEPMISSDTPGFPRLEYLCKCLDTVKSGLNSFLKIPPAGYFGLPFPFFTRIDRYIVVLYKLSTLNDPTWDTGLVRSDVNLPLIVDQLFGNLEHANVTVSDGSAASTFAKAARVFTSFRSWYNAKLAECTGDSANPGCQTTGDSGMLLEPEGLYDDWFKDVFAYGILDGTHVLPE